MRRIIEKYKEIPIEIKAAFWFMVCSFFQKGITTLTTPIFTRLLSATEYGLFSLFSSWLNILMVIITLKLPGGIYQKELVKKRKKQDELNTALLGLTTAMVAIWFVFYLLNKNFFNSLFGLPTWIVCLMFASILSTTTFDFWAFRQRVNYQYNNLLRVILSVGVLKPILGIILIILIPQHKIESRIISYVAIEVVSYLAIYIGQLKRCKRLFDINIWKWGLKNNIFLVPHYLSQSILCQADRTMIAKYCGNGPVGIYSVAYSISVMMNLVNQSVCDAMNPWINKCIKEDKKFEIRVTAEYIMKVIAGCDLLLVALAPEMISLFAPHEYYEAVWIIPPVGISILFGFMYSFFAVFEFYYERTRGIAVSSIVSAVMNIILNYIFIQKFGYIAAGYTTLFCYAVYCLCHYFAMRKIELDYFEGMRIYNIKYLLGVPVVVIFIGLFLMTTFKMFFVRYVFVIICTYFVLQNLNKILFLFKRKTY